jgi:hypothetical protein
MRKLVLIGVVGVVSGCATMTDSLKLGGTMGALTGASATAAGYSAAGKSPSLGNLALGAGLGLSLGIFAAYLTHSFTEKDRQSLMGDQTQMHFGDLPPSPFIVPRNIQKGAR